MAGYRSYGRNIIHNGNFQVWQRGTSFAATTNGKITADRWKYNFVSSTGVVTISQDSSPPNVKSNYDLKLAVTTSDTSIAAGEYATISQGIEGFQFDQVRASPMTLSFFVRCSTVGFYYVALCSSGADETFLGKYYISAGNTWQKVVMVIPPIPAGTWGTSNNAAAYLRFTLMCGSTYGSGSLGWQAANVFAGSDQMNLFDIIGNYWQVSQVQLEAGGTASDFEGLSIAEDLALCERYFFCHVNPLGQRLDYSGGIVQSSSSVHFNVPAPTEMRATPSIAAETQTGWQAYNNRGLLGAGNLTIVGTSTTKNMVVLDSHSTGGTAGDPIAVISNGATGGLFAMSADI